MKTYSAILMITLASLVCGCTSLTSKPQMSHNDQLRPSNCALPQEKYQWSSNYPTLIWLSIDSLNLAGLEDIVSSLNQPHPRGFKWLLQAQNKNTGMIVREPTITASSHISTLTCSTAGKHGIFANTQWNGSKFVSGFSTPFRLETFASAIQKNNLKVVSAGFPSLDNSEPGRTVNEGFTYANSLGKSQLYNIQPRENLVHIWADNSGKTIGKVSINNHDFSDLKNFTCPTNTCQFKKSGIQDVVDITLLENGKLYRAYAQFITSNPNQIYVSALSSNASFPEATKSKHDACNLIFSPGKENQLSQFGPVHWIKGLQHRLNFFDQVWGNYLPTTNADVIFLYLEDVDSIRHQYSGDISSRDIIIQHYNRLDKVIGDFFSSLPNSVNVLVLGDHGMSTVKKEINIRKVIPEGILSKYHILTSGGTALFYHKELQSSAISSTPSPSELDFLIAAKKSLLSFKLPSENQPLFEKIFLKSTPEMMQAGLAHEDAPFMIAISNDKFSLQNFMSNDVVLADTENNKLPPPRPRGQHGHAQENPKMKTFLAGWGPNIDKIDLKNVSSNVELVPIIGNTFGWNIPEQCNFKANQK